MTLTVDTAVARPGHQAPAAGLTLSPAGARSAGSSLRWQSRYAAVLLGLDALAMIAGGMAALLWRFGHQTAAVSGVSYQLVAVVLVPVWLLVLAASRAYEMRVLGVGSEEFRRVANGATRFTALVALVAFAFKVDLARGFIAFALPTAAVLAVAFRYAARKVLHHARNTRGVASHRVLVVGSGAPAEALAAKLMATPFAGMRVVGACVPGGRRHDSFGDGSVPVVSSLSNFMIAVRRAEADTVAVAHSPGITTEVLRRISWELEGTGVDLVVAPALTDVAGPRIHVRPVGGLPLLHIEEPQFSGAKRVVKGTMDLLGAAALLVVLSPLLLGTLVAVRLTSAGPAIFRQTRVGRDGKPFTLYKFRSMLPEAEALRNDLVGMNEHAGGLLFKIRSDPRVTPLGRMLRRYSIDELPQLVNVMLGQMSLVGPRPPLPSEVALYASHVQRRLLVKPGLTGLWQVSGRSDLAWDESVQLDLYYVENWSVALDTEILWKTLSTVLRGSGAY